MKRKQLLIQGMPVIQDPREVIRGLQHDDVIGIDLETTGLNAWRNNIALIQLYGEKSGTLGVIQITDGVIPQPIKDLFTKNRTFIVHNGVGFDLWFMHTHEIPWRNSQWHDTLVGEMVLTPTGRKDIRKSLGESLRRRLGKTIDKTIEHGNWGAAELSDRQLEYAAEDVLSLPALYRAQLEKARASNEIEALAMEMELVPHVAQMSINGLPMREEYVRKFTRQQRKNIQDAEKKLFALFGPINLNSYKQLKEGFHRIGIPIESTGVEALIPLSQMGGKAGDVADILLEWKYGAQRIKMYSEEWVRDKIVNDWVHPHFWQCSADTTRFTCSDPNLQQVPKDSRHIIGNIPGYKIVSADYSQIEVRISAYYAKDERLIAALEEEDVHRAMASEVFQKPQDQITKDERKLSKALSFTLLFGGGSTTLYNHARMSGGSMTEEQAQALTNQFYKRFEGLHKMKKKAERMARSDGPIIIRLPNTCRRILVGPSKRSTVILNTVVQGTAAVGIKQGILEAGRRGLVDAGLGSQVHDELIAAVKGTMKQAREYAAELQEAMIVGMRKVVDITVKVDSSIGDNWKA